MAEIKKRKNNKFHGFIIFLILFVIAALIIYDGNTRLVTDEYTIEDSLIPEAFDGFRIVQLSDLHGAEFGKDNSSLYAAVIGASPDIIALTGDFIDENDPLEYAFETASALTSIAPVYYVTGNHEWDGVATKELLSGLKERGVHVLQNEFETISIENSSIVIVGAEDPNGPYDMMTPDELIKSVNEACGDCFTVVLNHRNDRLSLYSELGVNFVMSGHAHGGVVRLPFTDGLISPTMGFFPSFTSGIYSEGNTQMLVSRGIGNTYPSFRIFNNPEIVVAVLKNSGI